MLPQRKNLDRTPHDHGRVFVAIEACRLHVHGETHVHHQIRQFSSSSCVSLMLPVSSKWSARATIDGSFRKRSPSSNHFCAEDKRPSLVQDKPPCFSNKRLCVSSSHSGVGCVRLAGGGFGGMNTPDDAIGSDDGRHTNKPHNW